MSQIPETLVPDPDELRDTFARVIAVCIVSATLFGAGFGYLQVQASAERGEADRAATSLGIAALGGLQRGEQETQTELERIAVVREARVHASNLNQQLAIASVDAQAGLAAEQQVWEVVAQLTHGTTELESDEKERQDPLFPALLVARGDRPAVELAARQDASIETSTLAGKRAATYTAVLTLIAVSVYLMGLSLSVKTGWPRRSLALLGVGLLLLGIGWGGSIEIISPRGATPDDAAAASDAFADAQLAFVTADGAADFAGSVDYYAQTVSLRPGFARAHEGLALAAIRAGSPQRSSPMSVVDREALEVATVHFQAALDAGLENQAVLNGLGFHSLLLALETNNTELLAQATELLERAVDHSPERPLARYDLGLALLLGGFDERSREEYAAAAELTLVQDRTLAVASLTDLEVVLSRRPELASSITEVKESIVGAVWGARDVAGGPLVSINRSICEPPSAVDDCASPIFGDSLQVGIDYIGLSVNDTITVIWYHNDVADSGWLALPEASGSIRRSLEGSDSHYENRSVLARSHPPRCLTDGDYRAELYVNGDLVDSFEASKEFGGLRSVVFPDLGVAACLPAGWEPQPGQAGYRGGYTSADSRQGMYVSAMQQPKELTAAETAELLHTTIEHYAAESDRPLLPGPVELTEEADSGWLMDLNGAVERWYTYEGGTLNASAAWTPEGVLMVAFIFGPDESWEGPPLSEVQRTLVLVER